MKHSKKKISFSSLVSESKILPFFYRIAVWLYTALGASFFGRFFSDYDSDTQRLESSIIGSIHKKLRLEERLFRPLRFLIAVLTDNSCLVRELKSLFLRFGGTPVSVYGMGFLTYSFVSCLGYVATQYISAETKPSPDILAVSAGAVLIGVILFTSHNSLAYKITQSRMVSAFLFRVAGIRKESLESIPLVRGSYLLSGIIGVLLGLCTFVFSPVLLVLGFFLCCGAYLILKMPEFGLVTELFLLPFLPTMVLVVLSSYTVLCFLFKCLRGKRVISLEWLDICVLLFMAVLLLAGVVSASPSDSIYPVAVFLCFMCSYFLCVNLIRSGEWMRRCITATISSAVLVSLYGIYQYFFATADTTWQDTSMFSDISGRVVSTFENPNVLAEYLIMCLPIIFALFLSSGSFSRRFTWLVCLLVTGACLVFTWSRGAWLGLMLGILLLLLIYSRKTLVVLLFGVLCIPFLPFVLPESVTNRFLSIGNLSDTSTSYRVHIWEGVINMVKDYLLGGIGVGVEVFQKIYPRYSLSGIESAPHSHNLFLQILVETGILGLLLFLILLVTFSRHTFSIIRKPIVLKDRLILAGLFCGVAAVLAQGMTDYIWYNYRVFLMFWLMFGLTVAQGRLARTSLGSDVLTSAAGTGQYEYDFTESTDTDTAERTENS